MNGHSVVNWAYDRISGRQETAPYKPGRTATEDEIEHSRKKARAAPEMNRRREFWNNILLIAIAAFVVAWVSFAWTATTGLTFVTRTATGRFANAEDRTRSRTVAVLTTVIAAPVALLAAMQRKRM